MKKNLNLNITSKDVLVITDIQQDFLPGGALPVNESDLIIPIINDYINIFEQTNAKIVAARDWHPKNHVSFNTQGGPWPPHCIQGTEGAKFSVNLKLPKDIRIFSKAADPTKEAYSVFAGTGLADELKAQEISRIFICGLATDYCIMNSVLDARTAGFNVIVLVDAIQGINKISGDIDRALQKMVASGAVQATLDDFPEPEVLSEKENPREITTDKPLIRGEIKKKARMRSKGSIRIRSERN